MFYPVILHQDHDGGPYGVVVPDFPGAFTAVDDLAQIQEAVQEAVELWFEGEEEREIPRPSSLSRLKADPDAEAGAIAMVDLDLGFLAKGSERVNLSIPRYALAKIDRAAKAAGKTRSAYLVERALGRE